MNLLVIFFFFGGGGGGSTWRYLGYLNVSHAYFA